MTTIDLMGELELIEIKQRTVQRAGYCHISKERNVFTIPRVKVEQLKWRELERVNLYCIGSTFVLKPDKTGLLTARTSAGGTTRINSTNLCLELMSRTKSCREFDCWVEQNMLFFKPERREDE